MDTRCNKTKDEKIIKRENRENKKLKRKIMFYILFDLRH
jgi:hypothetical protein